jgi:hypothetical protein
MLADEVGVDSENEETLSAFLEQRVDQACQLAQRQHASPSTAAPLPLVRLRVRRDGTAPAHQFVASPRWREWQCIRGCHRMGSAVTEQIYITTYTSYMSYFGAKSSFSPKGRCRDRSSVNLRIPQHVGVDSRTSRRLSRPPLHCRLTTRDSQRSMCSALAKSSSAKSPILTMSSCGTRHAVSGATKPVPKYVA